MSRPSAAARGAVAVATVACLGHVGLVLLPPPAQRQWVILPETPLLERLFPAVPAEWVLACVACVLVSFSGFAFAAALADRGVPSNRVAAARGMPSPAPRLAVAILVAALVHLAGLPFVGTSPRWFQLLYLSSGCRC